MKLKNQYFQLAAREFTKRKFGGKTDGDARVLAQEYLKYLYTEEKPDIGGKNFYRPTVSEKAKAKYARQFPKLNLFTIEQAFGGWAKADKDPCADGGAFDQIYLKQ